VTRSFLADEHVRRPYVTELRANGYDVAWVDDAYEQGTTDRSHLRHSEESGRTVLTNDADFLRHHAAFDHGGIILYDDQTRSVGEFLRGVRRVERLVPTEELAGEVVWLDGWVD